MNQHQRRAGVFMAIGLAAAVVVGLAVWNLSTPDQPVTAGYASAESGARKTGTPAGSPAARSQAATRADSADSADSGKIPRRRGKPDDTALAGQPADAPVFAIDNEAELREPPAEVNPDYRMDADPFAPPLAVTNAPQSVAPTTAYRPTNVRPATLESNSPPPSTSDGDNSNQPPHSERPETSPPVRTTPAPSEPSAPAQTPAEPVAPNRPDQTEQPVGRPFGAPLVERGAVSPEAAQHSAGRTSATVTPLHTPPGAQPSPREQLSREQLSRAS